MNTTSPGGGGGGGFTALLEILMYDELDLERPQLEIWEVQGGRYYGKPKFLVGLMMYFLALGPTNRLWKI